MYPSKKVVWAEGVFLGQQHFQQWEQFLLDHHSFVHRYQFNKGYGLCRLSINFEKLKQDIFQIEEVVALLPDGRWIAYSNDGLQEPLLCNLGTTENEIYIGLPYSEVVDGISGYPSDEHRQTAWQADYQVCKDLYDPLREREVLYAKQRLILTTNVQHCKDCSFIKIAITKENNRDGHRLQAYIPPLIDLRASSFLIEKIGQLQIALNACIKPLQLRFEGTPAQAIRKDQSLSYELAVLSMLVKYKVRLSAYQNYSKTIPSDFYQDMCEMLSELCLNNTGQLIEIKPYALGQLTELLLETCDKIISFLGNITPSENKTLLLNQKSETLYVSDDLSNGFHAGDYLYLEVSGAQDNDAWAERFMRGVKLGSANKIHDIYASAVAGVIIKHIKRPPSAINIKPGCEYFEVKCDGMFWQQVIEDGRLGILKGKEFISVDIHLIVIERN